MNNDDYNYNSAGFDGFLSRSIDGLTQNNLESQGPATTQIRYDSSLQTGPSSDLWRVGPVQLDQTGLKISKSGTLIAQARDDEIIFDSNENIFKITNHYKVEVDEQTALLSHPPATITNSIIVPHSLGVIPICLARWLNEPLPAFRITSTDGHISLLLTVQDITTESLTFNVFTPSSNLFYNFNTVIPITYSLLVRTNPNND